MGKIDSFVVVYPIKHVYSWSSRHFDMGIEKSQDLEEYLFELLFKPYSYTKNFIPGKNYRYQMLLEFSFEIVCGNDSHTL